MKQIETLVVTITPDLAKHLLAYNHGNRKLREKTVKYWIGCLKTGSITMSHQGIAMAGDMCNPIRIIDGQHRLEAIVSSGISWPFLMAFNVPEDSFKNIDNGLSRTMTDRTELSSSRVKIASSIVGIRLTRTFKAPVDMILAIDKIINPYASLVKDVKIRNLSAQAMRCAFVLQQKMMGYNYSDAFYLGDFKNMSDSLCALYRRQVTSPIPMTGSASNKEVFCATWLAITKPDKSRVNIPNDCNSFSYSTIDSVFPEIKEVITSYGFIQNENKS